MIAVSEEAARALAGDPLTVRARIRWYPAAGSEFMDWTDRLVDGGLSQIERSLGPLMAGTVVSAASVTLDNSDGLLGPGVRPGFFQDGATIYHNSKVTIEEGVQLEDGSFEYWDRYVGRITNVIYHGASVEVYLEDALSVLLARPLPVQYSIPFNEGGAGIETSMLEILEDVIDYGPEAYSTVVDATDVMTVATSNGLRDAGWIFSGTIPEGTVMGDVVNGIARSGLANAISTESGKLRFHAELPEFLASDHRLYRTKPGLLFDSGNCIGFEFSQLLDLVVSQVTVSYQGTTCVRRDTTNESVYGRRMGKISMPYCGRGHQAAWAANWLLTLYKGVVDRVAFQTSGLGRLVQIGDWIRVSDPYSVERLCRVTGTGWTLPAVGIVAMAEGHSDIIGDDYALYNVTSWGGAAAVL